MAVFLGGDVGFELSLEVNPHNIGSLDSVQHEWRYINMYIIYEHCNPILLLLMIVMAMMMVATTD